MLTHVVVMYVVEAARAGILGPFVLGRDRDSPPPTAADMRISRVTQHSTSRVLRARPLHSSGWRWLACIFFSSAFPPFQGLTSSPLTCVFVCVCLCSPLPLSARCRPQVHTVPTKVTGKCGSVTIRLIPAPRGAGIVAARTPKKVLQMAGIEDCYTGGVCVCGIAKQTG